MSLENSQYTFYSLQSAGRHDYQKEVDRITKEVDQVEANEDEGPPGPSIPAKRGRFPESASSQLQSSSRLPYEIRPVSGTILQITVEDFMCHDNMTVSLNKEVNFIVGKNGSGKSAILTALVVGLGGNASTTGRGAALKDFVKRGCAHAKVSLSIHNAGALSYKREEYGNKISVVRVINAQGGSTIKLRSEKGKVISSKMEDLRAMTLKLGIQVDNPISVLDQNTARHFLNQSKPVQKFELFMKATNLETLQNIFVEIAVAIDRINQEIKKKDRQLDDNNGEVEEAQRKWDMLQNMEKDREKEESLKMELLWAKVRESVNDLKFAQKQLEKVLQEKVSLDQMLSSEEHTEPLLQEIESLKAKIGDLETQRKGIESDMKALQQKYSDAINNKKKFIQEKQQMENKLNREEKTIEEYKTEISSQEQKMLPEYVERRRRQKEEIFELQQKLEQFKDERDLKEAEVRKLQSKSPAMNDNVQQLKRKKRYQEDELRNLQSKLQQLQSTDSNMSLFGPCMPNLVREIEIRSRDFQKKPFGPLGSFVKVKDTKWALAVESVIKARLHTFVVQTERDEKLLLSLIKKHITTGPKVGVVRTSLSPTPYDTSSKAARIAEYSNVLDMIEFSNFIAQNMFIDFCSIDTVLLIPTDNECHDLLSSKQTVPKNCTKAYTLNGDSYIPAPQFATYGSTQHTVNVLESSRADIIRDIKQRIHNAEEILVSLHDELNATTNELLVISKQITQIRNSMMEISRQAIETRSMLEKLKDMEQPDTNSVSVLREELVTKEKELQEIRRMLEEFPGKLEDVENEKQEIKQKGSKMKIEEKKIAQEIESFQIKQKTCRDQIEEFQSAQAGKKRRLNQVTKSVDEFTTQCEELEEKVSKGRVDAEKYEGHIQSECAMKGREFSSISNTTRNIKVIDQDLRLITKRLASIEKTLGQNAETTEREFHEKLAAYNATKKAILDLKHNAAYLKRALDDRKSLYHTQKKLMCSVVSHQFTRVLRLRNCAGHVRVNFEKQVLDISVGPIDEGERAGLGTSSLSGGERSYATMAFVIALWNVTELPFYYLDEFDVFMDVLNRQTVLKLLLKFAMLKRGYQFGFLTPLDTTGIGASDRISIFRMADPKRSS